MGSKERGSGKARHGSEPLGAADDCRQLCHSPLLACVPVSVFVSLGHKLVGPTDRNVAAVSISLG